MNDTTHWAGYVAGGSASGLAIAHLTVYTVGFFTQADATWPQYLIGGVIVSAVAAGLAVAAFVLARADGRHRPRRLLVAVAWFACVLFTMQAALLVAAADPRLFAPDRPGTYSLLAGPAFGLLAWNRRAARPKR
ncbi:hypothetical protein ACFFMR_32680 [Micromonospora andamanensis]|uniref:Integral membrane protein n=1 Tax=Micromonospora andamanensis TaxID=1287068 RepID=A0ABQ4I252_9ACTN|nr:hypothetical protein [Micromonospora andamanensis]GIJ11969.1 hypothetical protein Van01_51830 [Micromonospora andamanensis]